MGGLGCGDVLSQSCGVSVCSLKEPKCYLVEFISGNKFMGTSLAICYAVYWLGELIESG